MTATLKYPWKHLFQIICILTNILWHCRVTNRRVLSPLEHLFTWVHKYFFKDAQCSINRGSSSELWKKACPKLSLEKTRAKLICFRDNRSRLSPSSSGTESGIEQERSGTGLLQPHPEEHWCWASQPNCWQALPWTSPVFPEECLIYCSCENSTVWESSWPTLPSSAIICKMIFHFSFLEEWEQVQGWSNSRAYREENQDCQNMCLPANLLSMN